MHISPPQRLRTPATDSDLDDLAALLVDAVETGAAVSFLAPLTPHVAREWWQRAISTLHPRAVVLVARDERGIVGTVQLQPAWAPNQPRRAEVCKLIVHSRCRRRGVGDRLMHTIEEYARAEGFTLLTLDAKRGAGAHALYERLGWVAAGVIPASALDTDGVTPHDAVVMYKAIAALEGPGAGS